MVACIKETEQLTGILKTALKHRRDGHSLALGENLEPRQLELCSCEIVIEGCSL